MTKLSINLIRHAEKRLFLPNPGLTDLGKKQAENLAIKLANNKLANNKESSNKKILILTSPQRRTQETAKILAEHLQLQLIIDEFLDIDRQINQSPQGKQQIIKHFSDYFNNLDPKIEQGEILAVTHSQNIKNYWHVLAGPDKAIKDVYECGVWTIVVEGEKIEFKWTEGDLNP